jgi:hypothetical protein
MDDVEDGVDVRNYIYVPEPEHLEATSPQICRTCLVVDDLLGVLSAIDLDDQGPLKANEIDDIRPNRPLPAKLVAFDIAAAQA